MSTTQTTSLPAPAHLRSLAPRSAGLRRGLAIAFGCVVVAAAILGTTQTPASAAASPGVVNQCNGVDNGGGRAVECDVTITNYLDVATGVSSSEIVVRTCSGAAGADPLCTVLPATFPTATTVVDQCNGSGNGGGATVTCRVSVVNTIVGDTTLTPATVNQCVGSGAGGGTEPTLNCDPVASTTGATITQCNGSANGGGASMRVTCTVDPSTASAAIPVTINQCNGSTAAGSLVTCTASLTHRFLPVGSVIPSPTPTTPPGTTAPAPTDNPGSPAPSPIDTIPGVPAPVDGASPVTPTAPSPAATGTATPLIPTVAGPGNGTLAKTGVDAQAIVLIAGGTVLVGAVLITVMLLRRRRAATSAAESVQTPTHSD